MIKLLVPIFVQSDTDCEGLWLRLIRSEEGALVGLDAGVGSESVLKHEHGVGRVSEWALALAV